MLAQYIRGGINAEAAEANTRAATIPNPIRTTVQRSRATPPLVHAQGHRLIAPPPFSPPTRETTVCRSMCRRMPPKSGHRLPTSGAKRLYRSPRTELSPSIRECSAYTRPEAAACSGGVWGGHWFEAGAWEGLPAGVYRTCGDERGGE